MSQYLPNLDFLGWTPGYTYPPEYHPIPVEIEHIWITMLARMIELQDEQKDRQTPAYPQSRPLR